MNQDFKIFLDTNILVHATLKDYEPDKYSVCSKILNNLFSSDYELFISTQILREFYAVVTSKKYLIKPLSAFDAIKQIKFFQSNIEVLPVDVDVMNQLLNLTEKHQIIGQKIHDTTIAAVMVEFEVNSIITYNKKDFKIFSQLKIFHPDEFIFQI